MNRIDLNPLFVPNPTTGRALALANIYIGEIGLDPEIETNRKTVIVLQEDGTEVTITQPLQTGSGGVILYDGSPVTAFVDGEYSMKVTSSIEAQNYYIPKNTIGGIGTTVETIVGEAGVISVDDTDPANPIVGIEPLGVDTAKLAAGAVEEDKIGNKEVTTAKIADNAIGSLQIAPGAVDTDELATDAVTTIKVADAQITEAKLSFTPFSGDVSELATRTTIGSWSITGVDTSRPLYFGLQGNGSAANFEYYVSSGAGTGGGVVSANFAMFASSVNGNRTASSFVLVPTSSTVVISVQDIDGTAIAFQ